MVAPRKPRPATREALIQATQEEAARHLQEAGIALSKEDEAKLRHYESTRTIIASVAPVVSAYLSFAAAADALEVAVTAANTAATETIGLRADILGELVKIRASGLLSPGSREMIKTIPSPTYTRRHWFIYGADQTQNRVLPANHLAWLAISLGDFPEMYPGKDTAADVIKRMTAAMRAAREDLKRKPINMASLPTEAAPHVQDENQDGKPT